MTNPLNHIKNSKLKIIVKPNSPKSEITGYNKEKQAIKINIKAQPEKGKANKEVIRFLTKALKKQITIKSGLTSKTKIIEVK